MMWRKLRGMYGVGWREVCVKGQKKACIWASWLVPGYIIMVYPGNGSQGNVAAEIFLL